MGTFESLVSPSGLILVRVQPQRQLPVPTLQLLLGCASLAGQHLIIVPLRQHLPHHLLLLRSARVLGGVKSQQL